MMQPQCPGSVRFSVVELLCAGREIEIRALTPSDRDDMLAAADRAKQKLSSVNCLLESGCWGTSLRTGNDRPLGTRSPPTEPLNPPSPNTAVRQTPGAAIR